MQIRDILRDKGPTVITIAPELPLQEAVQVLVRNNIGALVVSDGSIRGIVTERDLLRRAAQNIEQLARALVRDVMDIMTEHRIRHLPVVDNGQLAGIISIGDVVNALRSTVETENRYLHAYIEGRPL